MGLLVKWAHVLSVVAALGTLSHSLVWKRGVMP